MGCATSCAQEEEANHECAISGSLGSIPDSFIGTWANQECELFFSTEGIEWRGPPQKRRTPSRYGRDSLDSRPTVFTMVWTLHPSDESELTPHGDSAAERPAGLGPPLNEDETIVFSFAHNCDSEPEDTSSPTYWSLRPHTEYTENTESTENRWGMQHTLVGTVLTTVAKPVRFELISTKGEEEAPRPRQGPEDGLCNIPETEIPENHVLAGRPSPRSGSPRGRLSPRQGLEAPRGSSTPRVMVPGTPRSIIVHQEIIESNATTSYRTPPS